VLLLPPLRVGVAPGSRGNETDFEGLEGHYTRKSGVGPQASA